jgi:hypothetical protein
MARCSVSVLICLLFVTLPITQPILSAQTSGVIDGSQHPEQIPDATAYRLVLANISELPNPTADRQARQHAFLDRIGFNDDEAQTVVPILTAFKMHYNELIDEYNKSVVQANASGTQPNLKAFLEQVATLVKSTRGEILTALGSSATSRFDTYVQNEKRRMKVAAQEATQ